MPHLHKIEANEPSPASVLATVCDRIPLSLFCPGGLAIVINFVGCLCKCDVERCPWDANLDPRSVRITRLSSQEISSLVSRYRPDLVFFHGAEPYLYNAFPHLVKSLSGVNIGVKVCARMLPKFLNYYNKFLQEIQYIVLLIEIIDLNDVEILNNHLDVLSSSKFIFEFAVLAEDQVKLHQMMSRIINVITTHGLNSVAINLVPTSARLSEEQVLHLVTTFREKFTHIYVPSSYISELASVLCHKCRLPIVVRRNYTVIKLNVGEQGTCKYCHSKVLTCVARHKLRMPLEEVIR